MAAPWFATNSAGPPRFDLLLGDEDGSFTCNAEHREMSVERLENAQRVIHRGATNQCEPDRRMRSPLYD